MLNSTYKVDSIQLEDICISTYELTVVQFKRANITPSQNIANIFVRLTTQSDPVLLNYRITIGRKQRYIPAAATDAKDNSTQHEIVNSLLRCTRDDIEGCMDCKSD